MNAPLARARHTRVMIGRGGFRHHECRPSQRTTPGSLWSGMRQTIFLLPLVQGALERPHYDAPEKSARP